MLVASVVPDIRSDSAYVTMMIGLVGTTIAPWMQFYQQASVVEKGITKEQYSFCRLDVILGCIMAIVVAFFIVVACAATIFTRHGLTIETAADAALALKPLVGAYASSLFAFGLFNASLFAACVLPLSTSYYICEGMGWELGVDKDFRKAPQFFWLFTASIVISALVILVPGAPLIGIMYVSQVVNGAVLPFVLIFMLLLVNDKALMGDMVNGPVFNLVAWATVIIMILLTLLMTFDALIPASSARCSDSRGRRPGEPGRRLRFAPGDGRALRMIRNLLERLKPFLLFDNKDHDLLGIVNDVLSREDYSGFKQLLTPYMHPRGIKEMAASKGLRIAYAAVNLLGSLEMGKARDRIVALSALKDEVMNASVTYLRMNTARVLLQIMKELVRSQDDPQRQLELAHDFRMAATGKARIVTRQLERYHLIRMPEDWSQSAFDHHVHDANTKGRKSATHLIMDAWIKGIRTLTVIYYNFISAEVAEELLQAAQIMNISVRMGIEFQTRFGHKQAKLIWVPRGFVGTRDFLNFLGQQSIVDFMEQGRKLSKIQESQILHVFGEFNANILPDLNDYFDIRMQPLTQEGFSRSMGAGQASMLHLGRYIHAMLLPHLEARLVELQEAWRQADPAEKARIEGLVEEMNALDAESLIEDYLEGMVSQAAQADAQAGSALYCPAHTPASLIETIMDLRVGNRFHPQPARADLRGRAGDPPRLTAAAGSPTWRSSTSRTTPRATPRNTGASPRSSRP